MTRSATSRYCALPPDAIVATCGQEFRVILRKVLQVTEVQPRMVAILSGIPRSSVYSLGSSRKGLPRLRAQVVRYLRFCRLNPEQAAEILRLWDELHETQV